MLRAKVKQVPSISSLFKVCFSVISVGRHGHHDVRVDSDHPLEKGTPRKKLKNSARIED
jgi:hypothetical protein